MFEGGALTRGMLDAMREQAIHTLDTNSQSARCIISRLVIVPRRLRLHLLHAN